MHPWSTEHHRYKEMPPGAQHHPPLPPEPQPESTQSTAACLSGTAHHSETIDLGDISIKGNEEKRSNTTQVLTSSNGTRVNTVHSYIMRLTELLSPDAHQSLIRCLGRSVDSLTRNTKSRTSGRDKHNPPTFGNVRDNSFGQEDRTANVAVEVRLIEFRRGVHEVCF